MTDHGSYVLMAEIKALKEVIRSQTQQDGGIGYADAVKEIVRLQEELKWGNETRVGLLLAIEKMEARAKEDATQYSELWKELQDTEKRLDAAIHNANQKQDTINVLQEGLKLVVAAPAPKSKAKPKAKPAPKKRSKK